MAHRPGRKAKTSDESQGIGRACGRAAGFLMLAGAAMGILACVVLVPAYADMAERQYQLERSRADLAEMKSRTAYNDRLIADLPQDPVLIRRLAMSRLNHQPINAVVVAGASAPSGVSLFATSPPHPHSATPSRWLMLAATRLRVPGLRRGLSVLAVAAMLAAMLLFCPPEKYHKPPRQSQA